MSQKTPKEERNPKLNAKKVNAKEEKKKNIRSDFQLFSNNDKKKQSNDNLYQNEEFYVTRLEIDKKIYNPTEKINKDRKKSFKKKDARSNFRFFSNPDKKRLNNYNNFQKKKEAALVKKNKSEFISLKKEEEKLKKLEAKLAAKQKKKEEKKARIKTLEKQKVEKKQQKLEVKQTKRKKIKTVGKTGFGWKGLEQRTEGNDNNIIEPSLKTVSKNDFSRPIDGLMDGIESANIKNVEKQGFFEKFYSSNNLLNRGNSTEVEFEYPEFLSTIPFQTNFTSKQETLRKMGSLKTSNFGFLSKNNVSQTETVQLEKVETTLPAENDTKIPIQEDFDSPLVPEMEIKDKETTSKKGKEKKRDKWLFTGIVGFDALLEKGIPAGSNIIVAGGPGCGKTIFCSQAIYNKASEGEDCVFLSMEERPDRLKDHMLSFGYKIEEISRSEEQIILRANGKGRIALKRLQPIRLARSIEALLEKASGTLPVDIDLVLDFIPKDFDACLLALDSISAIETAFSGTKRQYRIYIEQLFRYFEEMNLTTFMITESSDAPHKFSNTGVEEFLSDGIFVFYNLQGVKKRTRGAEIYKLRGAAHSQRIVPVEITSRGMNISSDESAAGIARG